MRIELKDVSKQFDQKQVIQPTSLVIEDGSFTTLLGPSGCGKTTLLRMIAGLETPDSGEIYLGGSCVFSAERKINLPPEKRNLGFVFQDFALWPHMTVFENVAFGLRARKDTADLQRRVREALLTVHLEGYEKRYPHQLSGGQQQRVAFARAIAVRPGCILFDEPLSALDALLREEMRRELTTLTATLGITAVFVTHDQTEAMSMSDRIAVLHGGTVEQYAAPEEVYHHPASRFVAGFIGKSNWLDEKTLFRPEAAGQEPGNGSLHFELPVQSVQYLGASYEITVSNQGALWTVQSSKKAKPGQVLPIYIDPKQIITFQEKEVLSA